MSHIDQSLGLRNQRPARRVDGALVRLQPYLYGAIEYSILALYLALLYKQVALVALLLLILSGCGVLVRRARSYVMTPIAVAAILYVFLAMGTAFLVSFNQGVYRTAQFILVLFAALAVTKFFAWADQERKAKFFRKFAILTLLVLAHLMLYHFATGKITTWKYLFDTKTVISIFIILLFLNEDWILRKLGLPGWALCLTVSAILVLMSGERKAYLLFGALYVFSRTPFVLKVASGVLGIFALALYMVTAQPDDYVARQLGSAFKSEHQIHISEFYNIRSIADQSDLIREFVNRNAWDLFLSHPITGVGATGYLDWANKTFGSIDESGGLSMNVHGEIARLPAEEGLVGIAVACSFLVLLAYAIVMHFSVHGWSRTPSRQRAPLYVFCFLFLYASFEASDTIMLAMIIVFGLEMARLHEANRRYFRSVARRPKASDRRSAPTSG